MFKGQILRQRKNITSSSLTAFLCSTTSVWLCELACIPQYCVETEWEVEERQINRRQSLVELRKKPTTDRECTQAHAQPHAPPHVHKIRKCYHTLKNN